MIEGRVDVAEGSGKVFYSPSIRLYSYFLMHSMHYMIGVVHTRLSILPIMQRIMDLGLEVNGVGGIMTGRIGRKERERGHARLSNSIGCGRQEGEGHYRELHPKMVLGKG